MAYTVTYTALKNNYLNIGQQLKSFQILRPRECPHSQINKANSEATDGGEETSTIWGN